MANKKYLITIEGFSLDLPPCGFKEFITRFGRGIGRRAKELAERYGVHFRFLVPMGCKGCFGPYVDYLECRLQDRHSIEKRLDWESDIYHLPTQYCKFRSMRRASQRLLTVHDVNFRYNKKGLSRWNHRHKIARRIAKADRLAFVTEFAAADIRRSIPFDKPFRMIPNGVTDMSLETQQPVEGIEPGYILHISNLLPNKQPRLMIDMMRYMPDQRLVIAGNLANDPRLVQYAADVKNVKLIGTVSEQEKAWLYANSAAFIFPSLCEGFGLPPLEAMTMGKPVIMSALTSLPEVGADAAWYFRSFDPESMAEDVRDAIAEYAINPALPEKIRKNALRYNWDDCVDAYIDCYLEMLGINPDDSMDKSKKEPKVIVSLTSYPPAIGFVAEAVKSLLNGSVLPDRLILYVTPEEFGDKPLPQELLTLASQSEIFEIRHYPRNIRSYRKLIPALQEFPDDIIVTVDDDVRYDRDMLRDLLQLHRRYPEAVIAHRAKQMDLSRPYRKWHKYRWYDFIFRKNYTGFRNLQTGVAGVLYPPHALDSSMLREDLFMEMAPTTDDIWFWAAAVANSTPIIPVPFGKNKPKGLGKPKESSLKTYNFKSGRDRNFEALTAILDHFPAIKEKIENSDR